MSGEENGAGGQNSEQGSGSGGGLLDALSKEQGEGAGGDAQSTESSSTESQAGAEGAAPSLDEILAGLEDKLATRFDAVADRRVNAILEEMRKQNPQGDAGGSTEGGSSQDPPAASSSKDDGGLVKRLARAAGRDYLGDQLKYLGPEERALGQSIMDTEIAGLIQRGETDDARIGQAAASTTVDQIQSIRTMYESQITAALKAKGLLAEKPGTPAPAAGGQATAGATQAWDKGAERARRLAGTASEQN